METQKSQFSLNRRQFIMSGSAVGAAFVVGTLPNEAYAHNGEWPQLQSDNDLWFIEGTEHLCNFLPSVSADGTVLAFAAADEEWDDLYIGRGDNLDELSYELILPSSDEEACLIRATAVSPDGSRVACLREIFNPADEHYECQLVEVSVPGLGKPAEVTGHEVVVAREEKFDRVRLIYVPTHPATVQLLLGYQTEEELRTIFLGSGSAVKETNPTVLNARNLQLKKQSPYSELVAVPARPGSPAAYSLSRTGQAKSHSAKTLEEGDTVGDACAGHNYIVHTSFAELSDRYVQTTVKHNFVTKESAFLETSAWDDGIILPGAVLPNGSVLLSVLSCEINEGKCIHQAQLAVWD